MKKFNLLKVFIASLVALFLALTLLSYAADDPLRPPYYATSPNNEINVNANYVFNNDLVMNQDLSIKGDLTIQGITTLDNDLLVGTNALVVDDSTGSVGIGVSNPATTLEVAGGIRAGYFQDRENILYQVNPSSTTTSATLAGNVGIGDTAPAAKLDIKGAGTTTGQALHIANSADTDLVTVLDNGNVGIGLASPAYKCDISTAGAGLRVSAPVGSVQFRMTEKTNNNNADFSVNADGDLNIATGGSVKAIVESSGNVGIGTTTPSEKLDVIGNIEVNNSLSITGASNATAPTGTSKYIEIYIDGVLYEIEAKLPS